MRHFFLLLILLFFHFASHAGSIETDTLPRPEKFRSPCFAGCGEIIDINEREKCSEEKTNAFIKENMKDSSNIKIYGNVVIKFTVTSIGKIEDVEVHLAPYEELGNEIAEIFKKMPDWDYGIRKGTAINVKMNRTIKFPPDEKPVVKGCENLEDEEEKKECNRKKLKLFYKQEFAKIPKEKKNKLRDFTYYKYTINEKGQVEDIKIAIDGGNEAGEFTRQIASRIPDSHPAMKNGKPVSMAMTQAISFNWKHMVHQTTLKAFDKEMKARTSYYHAIESFLPKIPRTTSYIEKSAFINILTERKKIGNIDISSKIHSQKHIFYYAKVGKDGKKVRLSESTIDSQPRKTLLEELEKEDDVQIHFINPYNRTTFWVLKLI